MKLGEKIRYLREVEGTLRGYGREMTQLETVAAVKKEIGASISQSYLSQIESGARPHLTNATRMLLARFFRVHPGYLVDDPEGYHTELISDLRAFEDKLDLWLIDGAERFRKDAELSEALLRVAHYEDSRMCIVLLGEIAEAPSLAERLLHVLKPEAAARKDQATRPVMTKSPPFAELRAGHPATPAELGVGHPHSRRSRGNGKGNGRRRTP